ncbi:MAG TPA: hypothetical protein VFM18_18100 [Methanosarcina sp.]|nr:hypothetical protein [Methanosarcina sp.]
MTTAKEISEEIRSVQMDLWEIEKMLPHHSEVRELIHAARVKLGKVDGLLFKGKGN